MARPIQFLLVAGIVVSATAVAEAHFPILTAERPFVSRGEAVAITYGYGHPFEVEVAPARAPEAFVVHPPRGAAVDLTDALRPTGGDEAMAWIADFTPETRGDHVVAVAGPEVAHQGSRYQHFTKLVLHVPAVQAGWDRLVGHPLEVEPLTRPYGLPVGVNFRARLLASGAPLAGAVVEVERKNGAPPDDLPPEPFITRVEKTGADGEVAVTLDAPGWWIVSAGHDVGDGLSHRASLWVYVGRP